MVPNSTRRRGKLPGWLMLRLPAWLLGKLPAWLLDIDPDLEAVQALEPEHVWHPIDRQCPKCSSDRLFEAKLVNYTVKPVKPGPARLDYVDELPVDADTRKFYRELSLFICPRCKFKGYRVVRVGDGYNKENVGYGSAWERID